jgi:hypothetical protein
VKKVSQLLAHGGCFSPGTPASSATKTGRHNIVEILLKVALKHQKSKIKSKEYTIGIWCFPAQQAKLRNKNKKWLAQSLIVSGSRYVCL